jgi:POT family proton-dependent oligopeptide transporter
MAPLSGGAAADIAGHPRGLFYLAFTEAWERFSYYGMTGLLALYMVDELLLPGHVGRVAGYAGLRAALEALQGPLSAQALAAQIFGLYTGLVYVTPLLGGLIADRWIGQRNAVVLGALSMSAGHIAMTFDQSFLVALALLVTGSGLLKGNIAAQVGGLYPPDDEARRTRGFVIFSTGINVGAVIGPLLCGYLAQAYGWHYGFGIAALFMLVALAVYLYGYRYLPARVARTQSVRTGLGQDERRTVLALLAVIAITVFQSVAYLQLFNVGPVWTQQYVALDLGGFRLPVPWYQSAHSLTSVLAVPPLFWLWRAQARRGREPSDLGKIGIGAWLTVASNLILVAASVAAHGRPIAPLWPLLYCVVLGVGFLYYWPTLLALVSRAAPAGGNATLLGVTYLSIGVSSTLIGWIGGFYQRQSPAAFWGLHAAIAAGGGLAVAIFGRSLGRALRAPSLSALRPGPSAGKAAGN